MNKTRLSGLICLLLVCSAPAGADYAFWVLGSFVERDSAHKEGARLVEELGLDVLLYETVVDNRLQYRLLTGAPEDPEAEAQRRQRLAKAGVDEPWTLRFSDELPFMETIFPDLDLPALETDAGFAGILSEPVGSTSGETSVGENYVVAGSFQDTARAQALIDRLTASLPITLQTSEVSGQLFQRVLIGPVSRTEESRVIAGLEAQGVYGGWVLRQPASPAAEAESEIETTPAVNQDITPPVRGLRIPGNPSSSSPGGYSGDYHPAKLKKKSQPFPTPSTGINSSNPGRWRTDIASELRVFNDPGINNLEEFHPSVSIQAEYYRTWNDGDDIFAFVPFYRWDGQDDERTHFDIRELTWVHVADDWELRTGIRKVFWGVTESQHLVDIVNQTDNVENPDGEEKLGQPMINLSLTRDWGVLDFYLLTGFRERNFAGEEGRPRFPLLVDEDSPRYESSAEQARTDFAVRWSNYFGELEIGLSHFSGTSREPRFEVALQTDEFGFPNDAVLVPVYEVIDQTGIDAQYFIGDWAWKLEAITRSGQGDRFSAATFGFEKTFVGIFGTRGDLGIVAEYLFDDRHGNAPVIGEDDLALGFRYTMNNPSDSTALLVWLYDLDSDEYLMTLEASSRLGSQWKVILEASLFDGADSPASDLPSILNAFADPDSQLGIFQDEDFIKLEFIRYF